MQPAIKEQHLQRYFLASPDSYTLIEMIDWLSLRIIGQCRRVHDFLDVSGRLYLIQRVALSMYKGAPGQEKHSKAEYLSGFNHFGPNCGPHDYLTSMDIRPDGAPLKSVHLKFCEKSLGLGGRFQNVCCYFVEAKAVMQI